jgi:hypothetical protein
MKRLLLSVVMLCLAFTSNATAAIFELDFTAIGFAATSGFVNPPTDPVSGHIMYTAASLTSPIDSLTAISLVIGGHQYTLAEVGYSNDFPNASLIGGLANGVTTISQNVFTGLSNDFWIYFKRSPFQPVDFYYSVDSSMAVWDTFRFSQSSLTEVPAVPEPSTWAMMILGFLGVGWMACRSNGFSVIDAPTSDRD